MAAPLLLLIETSSPICSVALSSEGKLIAMKELHENANHASMLAVLIADMMKTVQITLKELDAVAISAGPGSYTGLRIGAATAKSLCFSLSKPLLAIDSLQALALGMSNHIQQSDHIYCPTIDARRDEIYFGLFDGNGKVIHPSVNIILNDSFLNYLPKDKMITVGGSGAAKCLHFENNRNLSFDYSTRPSAQWLIQQATENMLEKRFNDYHSFEPNYVKPAFVTASKSRL